MAKTRKARDGYKGKWCHTCQRRLTLRSFSKWSERGLQTRCKDCVSDNRPQNTFLSKKTGRRFEITSGRLKIRTKGGGGKSGWERRLEQFRATGHYQPHGRGAALKRLEKLVLPGGRLSVAKMSRAERRREATKAWKRW